MYTTKTNYKGYKLWQSSNRIIMLYIPNAPIGTTHHALSFDNGRTWCIGNKFGIVNAEFVGDFTQAIDLCVQLNKENYYEK